MSPIGNGQTSDTATGLFGFQTILAAIVTLGACAAATVWAFRKRTPHATSSTTHTRIEQNGHTTDTKTAVLPALVQEGSTSSVETPALELVKPVLPPTDPPATPSRPSTPRPRKVSFKAELNTRPPSRAGQNHTQSTDDADGPEGDESDGEGEAAATAGKRKGPRRKRGKKKKAPALPINGGDDGGADDKDESGEATPALTPGLEGNVEVIHVVSPSAIVVPPPTTSIPVIPSLIVSDTVLGELLFVRNEIFNLHPVQVSAPMGL